MPDVQPGESRQDFVGRCVPIVLEEGTAKDQDQAVAVCSQMWIENRKISNKQIVAIGTSRAVEIDTVEDLMVAYNMAKIASETDAIDKIREIAQSNDLEDQLIRVDNGNPISTKQIKNDFRTSALFRGKRKQATVKKNKKGNAARTHSPMAIYKLDNTEARSIVMKVTKVQRLDNGRTRWQARANTGEFDLLQERFDQAFFDDVITNFYRTKEALSRGEQPPSGMTEPILDISHYSIYLPSEKRNLARAGWIDKMWRDGRALFAQGFFDDTRLGQLAEKAAFERRPEDRRVSVVVYPDYSLVDTEAGGRKIYRGGNGYAWMDSLAMTSTPCDPGAVMEVSKNMTTLKDDAQNVLGDDGTEIVQELEQARQTKSLPEGAMIKTEEDETMSEDQETKTDENTEEEQEETTPEVQPLTMENLQNAFSEFMPGFGAAIDERLEPLRNQVAELAEKTVGLEAQVKALGASDVQKVQKAVQNDGDIFSMMWPDEKALSVQGAEATAKGKTPEETPPYQEGDVMGALGFK